MQIIVENQGRVCFGRGVLYDPKGITSNVTLGGRVLKDWKVTPLPQDPIEDIIRHFDGTQPDDGDLRRMTYWRGTFTAPCDGTGDEDVGSDTFLHLPGAAWSKGAAWLNGNNLGRYWPAVGPQETLYAPGVWIRCGDDEENEVVILEQDWAGCVRDSGDYIDCAVEFVAEPKLDGETPESKDNDSV